jgi:hypothetical protein
MTYSVGDRVRVNDKNDYDKDLAYDPADTFIGKVGTVVRLGYSVTVPENSPELYHVDLEDLSENYREDNPWVFHEWELDAL